MSSDVPIIQKNLLSKRSVVFDDDGTSAWLYLTRPNSEQPMCDCWIYNHITPPDPSEVSNYHSGPPPACVGYADANDTFADTAPPDVSFVWSKSGNDVAVRINGVIMGFIAAQLSAGYSRLLLQNGPWGRVWNQAIYASLFGEDD